MKNMNIKIKPIWVLNSAEAAKAEELKGARVVRHKSIQFFYYLMTSKVVISNNGVGSFYPKRKNQIVVNTWHGGGAYKRVGIETGKTEKKIALLISKQTDIFVSSSKMFTDVMTGSAMVPKTRFLSVGMPRNDIFFHDYSDIAIKVRQYYGISSDTKIILYAPTYRGDMHKEYFKNQMDIINIQKTIEERFGGTWVFAIRMHYFLSAQLNVDNAIDMSEYQDMQELLCAADVFITDYSSTIWDYSFLRKPGFLFVPDLKEYEKERTFYTEPRTWPFELATSNSDMVDIIKNFDQGEMLQKINKHHQIFGNYENGDASKNILKTISRRYRGGN